MPEPLLSETAVAERLAGPLSAWRRSGAAIARSCRTADWTEAMRLANQISDLAEAADHHPDLAITYGAVAITLTTHDAGGITERDLALAAQIEPLLAGKP